MKYCQISLFKPAFFTSSLRIASVSLTISSFSSVISPKTLIASPGPGNGCLHTISSGTPMLSPRDLTSSLNNSLSGSTTPSNSISSGSPPTLWWDFITEPFPFPLSITSG